jgi:hypothetical protein
MKTAVLILLAVFAIAKAPAQKVEEIYFNLYTDSLKKNVHNYINVDGKLSNGKFYPLDSKQITFSSSYGKWEGNDLIIDNGYKKDSVVVTAVLKDNVAITKSIVIYFKKNLVQERLRTEQEIFSEPNKPRKKGK